MELGHDGGHEARVSVAEAAEVRKVDVHSGALVAQHAVSLVLVVSDGSTFAPLLVGDTRQEAHILLVVLGLAGQFKATQSQLATIGN